MKADIKKILHIDDDPVMRMMTKKALERAHLGFEIRSCSSSHDFLKGIEEFQPDLLLVDFMMPVMNGEELISAVRNSNDPQHTCPVIYLSGKDHLTFKDRAKIEPILGVIQKPFSPVTLGQDLQNIWENFYSGK